MCGIAGYVQRANGREVVAGMMACATRQVSYWRSSETLWRHTLACTPENQLAYLNLGNVFAKRGEADKALQYYRGAIRLNPRFATAYNNIGEILLWDDNLAAKPDHFNAILDGIIERRLRIRWSHDLNCKPRRNFGMRLGVEMNAVPLVGVRRDWIRVIDNDADAALLQPL